MQQPPFFSLSSVTFAFPFVPSSLFAPSGPFPLPCVSLSSAGASVLGAGFSSVLISSLGAGLSSTLGSSLGGTVVVVVAWAGCDAGTAAGMAFSFFFFSSSSSSEVEPVVELPSLSFFSASEVSSLLVVESLDEGGSLVFSLVSSGAVDGVVVVVVMGAGVGVGVGVVVAAGVDEGAEVIVDVSDGCGMGVGVGLGSSFNNLGASAVCVGCAVGAVDGVATS